MSSTSFFDRQFEELTFTFNPGGEVSFQKCTFQKCRMILGRGRPQFLDCTFMNCSFEPIIHPDGRAWDSLLHGSIVSSESDNAGST
jgi:hypothetical protein